MSTGIVIWWVASVVIAFIAGRLSLLAYMKARVAEVEAEAEAARLRADEADAVLDTLTGIERLRDIPRAMVRLHEALDRRDAR